MAELVCPPLGSGSVDMNALHEAAKKNKPIDDKVIEAATTKVAAEEAAATPDTPSAPADPA